MDKKIYKQSVSAWVDENIINIKSCQRTIEDSKKIIALNEQQIELRKKEVCIGVDEYNEWAKENGENPMIYPF